MAITTRLLVVMVMVAACFVSCINGNNAIWVPMIPVAYNQSNQVLGGGPTWGCRPNHFNATGTHSVFLGCVGYNDRLLYSEAHVKSGKWFGTQDVTIKYPSSGYIRQEIISGIWIFDRYRNGQGGHAVILSGGPGSRNVTIQLLSTGWLRGFNFLVQIYGI